MTNQDIYTEPEPLPHSDYQEMHVNADTEPYDVLKHALSEVSDLFYLYERLQRLSTQSVFEGRFNDRLDTLFCNITSMQDRLKDLDESGTRIVVYTLPDGTIV